VFTLVALLPSWTTFYRVELEHNIFIKKCKNYRSL